MRGVIVAAGFEALYAKGDEEGQERLENLNELVSSAHDFETLHGLTGVPARNAIPAGNGQREAAGEETLFDEETEPAVSPLVNFLDYVSLVSDTDGLNAELGVAVMTLHSAKGLEYPAVFVTGLEDGLLPHFHAGLAARDIEEERRLFYVGMTRAEQRLFLSLSRRRMVAGQFQDQQPSPFIADLPEELVETTRSAELFGGPRTAGVRGFFGADRAAAGAGSFRAGSPGGAGRGRKPPSERIAGVLRPGAVVRHATLGKGVVLQLDGDGENAKLTVFFDKAGKRKLIRRYAPLDVL